MSEPVLQKVHLDRGGLEFTINTNDLDAGWQPVGARTYCGQLTSLSTVFDSVTEFEFSRVTCPECLEEYAMCHLGDLP